MKNNDVNGQYSRIENSTLIKGDIVSEGDLRIDGTLEGSIKTKGKIVVGKEGIIKGDVSCTNADVEGKIDGNLFVSENLNLRATSTIEGDVSIGKLIVEYGATFNASCSMNKDGNKADIQLVSKHQQTREKTA
ncbi:MAG: hypothetical protein CND43_03960 [Flavobacteriales bacterium MED-G15]|nr:MAG: hypothetical protein CND43_03960 [Flavobacteriales bacterium MED-G15]|tara:strand:+ start:954 stop:1352 length:399 start_codon:yes stop_codon:yes gene_type:complete